MPAGVALSAVHLGLYCDFLANGKFMHSFSQFRNLPTHLVSLRDRILRVGVHPMVDMDVTAAHTNSDNLNKYLSPSRGRCRNLPKDDLPRCRHDLLYHLASCLFHTAMETPASAVTSILSHISILSRLERRIAPVPHAPVGPRYVFPVLLDRTGHAFHEVVLED